MIKFVPLMRSSWPQEATYFVFWQFWLKVPLQIKLIRSLFPLTQNCFPATATKHFQILYSGVSYHKSVLISTRQFLKHLWKIKINQEVNFFYMITNNQIFLSLQWPLFSCQSGWGHIHHMQVSRQWWLFHYVCIGFRIQDPL